MKCPKCYLIHPDSVNKCYCGYEFNGESSSVAGGNSRRTFNFHGKGFDLFSIFIVNVLLILVTLGIYYFWGKVKIKRYLYSQLEFDGDRFSFHGTGKELFFGGIIGISLLVLTVGLQHLIEISKNNYIIAASVILLMVLMCLIPVIFVLSRRYYLSRSSWRGIRFTFRGKISSFYRVIIKGVFLTMVTFGLYLPFFRNSIKRFFINNSYFGNERFSYDGDSNEVFRYYAKAFFLYLPLTAFLIFFVITVIGVILGKIIGKDVKAVALILSGIGTYLSIFIVFTWFEFWFTKYVWNHTTFMNAKFALNINFVPYIKLKAGNILIYLLTVGLGWPWVSVRNSKFITDRLSLEGDLDFESVKQQFVKASATGESVADIFDIGSGLDLGI